MKLWNYLVIFTGMALLLQMGGITVPVFNQLFNLLSVNFNGSTLTSVNSDSTLWNIIFNSTSGLLATLGIFSVIVIGFFVTERGKNALVAIYLTGTAIIWLSVILAIVSYTLGITSDGTNQWIGYVLALILIPLSLGYIQSSIDYFTGVD